MPESTARLPNRLDPVASWTVLTEAPLKGMALAREAGAVLVWDERDQVALLDLRGEHRSVIQSPGRILAAAISDDGSLVALLGEGNHLWLLGPDLDVQADRQGPPESTTLAIDPHGRYVAVGSRLSLTQLVNRHGRQAGRFETQQPLAHLGFVPGRPFLLGAASYGMLVGITLRPAGASGKLAAEVAWQESLMSNVGRLTTTGDGGMILTSCFTHGVQRYDLRGQNEGAYHLGGTTAHAAPDFAGKLFAVATLEGELAILNAAGNVRWRSTLPRPAIALETDPLGRYLIYGQATGEVVRLDLHGPADHDGQAPAIAATPAPRPVAPRSPAAAASSRPRASSLRSPDWSIPVAATDEQAESAILTVLDDPPRIGLITNTNRLQVFTTEGKKLGQSPEILGLGRVARTAPGWIAAATDRQLILFNARKNSAHRPDLSLVEITHLAILPDTFGIALVQERDRLGRATLAGRWVWAHPLSSPVEDLAISPDGYTAVTVNDGPLLIFDAAGAAVGEDRGFPSDPPCLIEAPDDSPPHVTWLTLARRAQILRGHAAGGQILWESPVPWEGWQLQRIGPLAMVTAPDGRVLAYDGAGHLRGQGKSSDTTNDAFGTGPGGEALRVSRQGANLLCSTLAGAVRWRAVVDSPLGPMAASRPGVAVLIGRELAWFANNAPG